jgi:hypothetical protein
MVLAQEALMVFKAFSSFFEQNVNACLYEVSIGAG